MENNERCPSAHTSSQSQTSVVVPCVNEEEQSNTTVPFRGPNHVTTAEDFRLNGDVQSGLDYFSPFYMPAVSWHLANPEPASSGNEQEIRSSPFSLVDNASMPLVQGPVDEPSLSTWPSTLEPFSLLARYNEIVNTITGFPNTCVAIPVATGEFSPAVEISAAMNAFIRTIARIPVIGLDATVQDRMDSPVGTSLRNTSGMSMG
ncbi:uncharacterized protein TRUGW13939_06665 [Talaromyces rugulosus]|uniref:Uncharacterized protein n=1 Tax=Talaromyces rugulosus TaxID=121627 RepID=A0A7H8R1H2_TALRU|nr:uncharacterized protein TRUGW13939_06665 [Talaromyces rugulosus]QKX59531.1 hypothetical protein TRUGW13939_06665 [Talaromyces rugulosus]